VQVSEDPVLMRRLAINAVKASQAYGDEAFDLSAREVFG
jgi:hypothetical protein